MKIFATLLISVLLVTSAFFTVKAPIPENLYIFSSVFILLFAIPSYYILLKTVGGGRGLLVLVLLSLFAIGIETVAIKTGFPYGRFEYGEKIGYKLFGILPWTLSFAYVPLVLGTVTLAQKISTSKFSVIGISTALLVLCDLVIDPGAVSLRFWHYHGGGFFYDVPLINFVGWIITGALATFIFYSFVEKKTLSPKLTYSLFAILMFWTGIALWSFLLVPLFIGILLLGLIVRSLQSE